MFIYRKRAGGSKHDKEFDKEYEKDTVIDIKLYYIA